MTKDAKTSITDTAIKPRYVTTPDAALHLGLSPRTLEKHRCCGTGPTYRKLGGRVVYAIDDLEEWPSLEHGDRPQIRVWVSYGLPNVPYQTDP